VPLLTDDAKAYIGLQTDWEVACDTVEAGAVRRYAQSIMDDNPAYAGAGSPRYGGAVAPLFFPTHMFRRDFGEPDPLDQGLKNPDFDGSSLSATQGLPEIAPLKKLSILNGGVDVEFFRHARHGETVKLRSRYLDISEKQSSKGAMVIVVIESDYTSGDGELLCRIRRTYLRR
jgi:N-terminal half of MaoC dehydratase